jgi:hypothetical protein
VDEAFEDEEEEGGGDEPWPERDALGEGCLVGE